MPDKIPAQPNFEREISELQPEDLELLESHEDVEIFRRGAQKKFFENEKVIELTNSGKVTEEDKAEVFEQWWKANVKSNIGVILNEGFMQDWKQFVADKKTVQPAPSEGRRSRGVVFEGTMGSLTRDQQIAVGRAVLEYASKGTYTEQEAYGAAAHLISEEQKFPGSTADLLRGLGGQEVIDLFNKYITENKQPLSSDETVSTDQESVSEKWWENKIFIQRDSGDRYIVNDVNKDQGIIVLMHEGGSPTIGKKIKSLKEMVETPGSAWSMQDLEKPKPLEIKVEAKDWREVKREVEVDAVGDLHGSWDNFVGNLKLLGAAKEITPGKMEWTGGNRKVVLVGDILGDRNTQGLQILDAIGQLKQQAKSSGGQLDQLAGNHDDFVLAYLMKRSVAGGGPAVGNSALDEQGIGLLELHQYGSDDLKNYDWSKFQHYHTKPNPDYPDDHNKDIDVYDQSWDLLSRDQDLIIQNMRNSPEGRKRLEQMCEIKIAEVYDDTLFVHTDVTETMAKFLLEGPLSARGNLKATVENINKYFQNNLRKTLLEGQEPDANFDKLRQVFLYTDNRINFNEGLAEYSDAKKSYADYKERGLLSAEELRKWEDSIERMGKNKDSIEKMIAMFRKLGVNAIVHGHSRGSFSEDFAGDKFPIITADMPGYVGEPRSVVRINTSGVIERGINSKVSDKLREKVGKESVEEMKELRSL